ncbi:MAG: ATP-dependent DNA helicase RecQ [Deltaproteobacteria bacterium]|nr:ATP-dependent DNA helicase RecQ [Deltaproteobacteria bacterium]
MLTWEQDPAMDGSSDALTRILRDKFNLPAFRPGQREAIEAVLGDEAQVLVVAPTGGGKSLTYQLPATVLRGITLVISPLIALMEDQVRALEARGIAATFLASTLDSDARRARVRGLLQGRYRLVYVAPERLQYDGFVDACARCEVSLVAVDEAHCIAMWGHDFRPDYLRIGELLTRLKPPRVLACTATATPAVRKEIIERLGLDPARVREFLRGFARPNLHLAARAIEGPREARESVRRELSRVLGDVARPRGGAIVYEATRKNTEAMCDELRGRGWNAAAYHAGLDPEVRSAVSERFAARDVDVVVATNAFGMGIDRGDIRVVIHQQPPASIESYYQEVGRAGRDGQEAHGLLLCSGVDIALRRRLCQNSSDGQPAEPAQVARTWGLFRDLLRYLDAGTCRHDFVLRYFGDDNELLGGCGHCDVCTSLDETQAHDEAAQERASTVARMALSAVARARQRAGLHAVAEMLRGATTERTERFGFTRLSTFGLLKDHSQEWVLALLRALLAAGWVDLTPTEHPVPYLTASGLRAMKATETLRFRLPRDVRPSKKGSRPPPPTVAPMSYDSALFEKLRTWRNDQARIKGWPAYMVAFDRSLQELAARRPSKLEQLSAISGLGPARIEAWGEGLLAVIRSSA